MQDYKKLIVWQKAHQIVLKVYTYTSQYPKTEMYNLTSQLRRAAASVPTNIAEGSGKFTRRDFAGYLQIALGSINEVEYLIFLSRDLGYVAEDDHKQLNAEVNEVKAMLISPVQKVRRAGRYF